MSKEQEERSELFRLQISRLSLAHYLVLCWCTQSEGQSVRYNITNCFDDLKRCGVTRTKQTAVAVIETLKALAFVDIRDEHNRKNIYISTWGAKALEQMVLSGQYEAKASSYLEETRS